MWDQLNCQVQGRGHIKANLPCQDQTFIFHNENAYVIALADGAGSARLSEQGAKCASKEVSMLLCNLFDSFQSKDDEQVKAEVLNYVLDKLKTLSEELSCQIKDLASTLLAVAVKEDNYIMLHLGDGVIGLTKDESVEVLSEPTNGEYANSTYFTTSDDAQKFIKLKRGSLDKSITSFILMSDGTCASLYSKKENKLSQGLQKIVKLCKELEHNKVQEMLLGTFENVIKKNTIDDCSIAIMVNI